MTSSFLSMLLLQLFSTFFMTGLIWVIQLVHYPSFVYVDRKSFVDFENFHGKRISLIVIPAMVLELLSALGLYLVAPEALLTLAGVNLGLLLLVWAVTLMVSARLHGKLLKGYNPSYIQQLVSTNWARTFLWTARSFLVLYILILFKVVV